MAERKIWTQKEDEVLLEIIQVRKIKKWSAIARAMQTDYAMYGRTGKQCRERWHNQLDPNINNNGWSRQEEEILFQCHNEFGNKWAKIALRLKGRTDNNIKNHFYSTLRKGIRVLNKVISEISDKGQMKEFKGPILSKLITVAEDKFDRKLTVSDQLRDGCVAIKVKLIELSKEDVVPQPEECLQLAKDINSFNKSFRKRKSRRRRVEPIEEEGEEDTIGSSSEKNVVIRPKDVLPTLETEKENKTDDRVDLRLIRIDKSNHEQQQIGNFGEFPMMRKTSSQLMRSPLLGYRFSQPMEGSLDYGYAPLELESSGGIRDLLGGSQNMKGSFNIFNMNFGGDNNEETMRGSQNLFNLK